MVLIGVIPRDINQVIVFHFFVSSYLQFVIMAGSIHTYLYHPKKKKRGNANLSVLRLKE